MTKIQMTKTNESEITEYGGTVLNIKSFEFLICFGFRISCFGFPVQRVRNRIYEINNEAKTGEFRSYIL